MKIGIVGYGSYVPSGRMSFDETKSKKSVPGPDEDAATIAVAAASCALDMAGIDRTKVGAVYVGSESHPYAVKPTAGIVGAALSLGKDFMAADMEFACKGGTAAVQVCCAVVKSGMTEYAMAIGADTAQAEPGDVLEYFASAGGAAFILGSKKEEIIATIDATLSVTTDTPDFWRRSLQKYPKHMGRFTGEPAYFAHIVEAASKIMAKSALTPKDFKYVVFHQPNNKFPRVVAKRLGFSSEQLELGLLVGEIGNTYSANSLLGLAAVLDEADQGDKILVVSYGSGAGSDAFILTMGGGA